jgi:hypothetical protein
MSGNHAMRMTCFVVLAIITPYAITLHPPEPSPHEGIGAGLSRQYLLGKGLFPFPPGGGVGMGGNG